MRKLFILIGLFLTLSVSGQLLPGIVEGQKVAAAPTEMITNGTFDNGDHWSFAATAWSIAGGVAVFDNSGNDGLIQVSGDMASAITPNTGYVLEFDVSSAGAAYISVYSTSYQAYVAGAGYTTGHKTINFTSPADVGSAGIMIYANNDVAFTLDNVSLKLAE
jgi:hypothetical protein